MQSPVPPNRDVMDGCDSNTSDSSLDMLFGLLHDGLLGQHETEPAAKEFRVPVGRPETAVFRPEGQRQNMMLFNSTASDLAQEMQASMALLTAQMHKLQQQQKNMQHMHRVYNQQLKNLQQSEGACPTARQSDVAQQCLMSKVAADKLQPFLIEYATFWGASSAELVAVLEKLQAIKARQASRGLLTQECAVQLDYAKVQALQKQWQMDKSVRTARKMQDAVNKHGAQLIMLRIEESKVPAAEYLEDAAVMHRARLWILQINTWQSRVQHATGTSLL